MSIDIKNSICKKLRRFISLIHAYDYPSANGGWTKVGLADGLDINTVYFDPYVYLFDDELYMYVSNRNHNTIDLYKSSDGFRWTFAGEALCPMNNSQFFKRINRACVVRKENKWYMWFTGQTECKSVIGYAESNDGLHFIAHQNCPVIEASENYEGVSVMNPCVLWDDCEEIFKMWYSAGENYEPDVICYALSKDGINWQKCSSKPVLTKSDNDYDKCKVGGCDVHKTSSGYVMYYIGYQTVDNARICVARSNDGINWERSGFNPILSATKSSWDADAVYKPSALQFGNTVFMWYNGRKGNVESIGLAKNSVWGGNV